MTTRRRFVSYGAALAGAALVGASPLAFAAEGEFPFALTDEEWRARLTREQYDILRRHGTEYAFSSPLDKLYEPGTYHCAGCDHPLYASDAKYDSRTGWPSFWESLAGAIGTSVDVSLLMVRTECHCANCGGHLAIFSTMDPSPPASATASTALLSPSGRLIAPIR